MEHMDMQHSSSGAGAVSQQGLEAPKQNVVPSLWTENFLETPENVVSPSGHLPLLHFSPQTEALSAAVSPAVYRECVEFASEALLVFDGTGQILYVNEACATLLGRARENLIGAKVECLLGEDSPLSIATRLREEQAQEGWNAEWNWLAPDGRTHPIAVRCKAVGGSPAGGTLYVATLRDLSNLRLLEERLRESQKFEAIGGLAAGIAHDLKSFVAGILGCARFLLAELDESHTLYQELKSIAETANTAIDLANRLLALTRNSPSEMLVCSLNHLVEKTANVLKRSIASNVSVRLHLREDVPSVLCNPNQIEQVLMNLGLNAADAMPEGGELVFRTGVAELDEESWHQEMHLRPGKYVFFSVQDTGVGIPSYLRRKIFEPLFTTKQPGKGTGMGLAVAESIVREHRGVITVDSRVGVGSRFTVYLPVALEDQKEPAGVEAVKA